MNVRVLRAAQAEIRAAAGWYEAKRAGLGIEFLALVDEALATIRQRPLASPLWREDRDYRRKSLRRFPYNVFFRVVDQSVVVMAVAHQRRRPGYWAERK